MSNTVFVPVTEIIDAVKIVRDLGHFVNYPTLLPSEGSTTETAETPDYSDGYGTEYAKGE